MGNEVLYSSVKDPFLGDCVFVVENSVGSIVGSFNKFDYINSYSSSSGEHSIVHSPVRLLIPRGDSF